MRIRLRSVVAVLAITVMGGGMAVTTPATASAPPEAPSPATVLGARWLAAQLTPEGFVDGVFAPGPDAAATRYVALTLAGTGLERDAFERALGWITQNVDEVIASTEDPEEDSAGALGYLIMLAVAAGEDPTNFGGADLLERLGQTYGLREPGLYGATDPTFDGVIRQSLALLGFEAAGVPYPDGALEWLEAQQCQAGSSSPASVGGFPAYREDPDEPCPAPDPLSYTGAEVDATAMALQFFGLEEPLGEVDFAVADDAEAFLVSMQLSSGGFPWYGGGSESPNSTALAIGGLVAAGNVDAAGEAIDWLVTQQLGCDNPDAGAFVSSFSDGKADQFASRQAVLGVAGVSLPLAVTSWQTVADPCATPGPDPDEVLTPDPTGVPATGSAGVPISGSAAPRFTG